MSRGYSVLFGIGVLTVAIVAWAFLAHRPQRYRYRLTVEVVTPEGRRSGSAVRAFIWTRQPTAFTGVDVHYSERGEAVVVDLPRGRSLFVLLNVTPSNLVEMAVNTGQPSRASVAIQQASASRTMYVVPRKHEFQASNREYPRFVTFADMANPKSIAAVDPDDLANTFGGGVMLDKITFQVVDDSVTAKIDGKLPWLKDLRRDRVGLNGKRNVAQVPGDITTIIGPGSFYRKGL